MSADQSRTASVVSDLSAHLSDMTTETTTGRGLEPLMNIEELAEYLGVPVATIYDWRVAGRGPCAIRVGRSLKFAVPDVRDWLARHRETSPGHVPQDR
jgi:excisionase family DNA binding protein